MSKYISDTRILRGMQAQLALRAARLENGDSSLGWKAGFGSPQAMEKLGTTMPLVGFLTAHSRLQSGEVVAVGPWKKPAMEPEIAIQLAHDLGAGATRQQVQESIGAVGMAIELADVEFPPEDVEKILAGNIYNRYVILGPSDTSRAGGLLHGLVGQVYRNGTKTATTDDLQALTGDPVEIVRHAANLLGMFGEQITAGEWVIAGSIVPPLWIEESEEIRYQLEPLGELAVKLDVTK
ncbi:MAG: hypothetical protein OEZ02_10260 [Anaerolineae bacterium]|nr:hypothetical protein [Anaerolineae bacterium]